MAFPTTPIIDPFTSTENPLSGGGAWVLWQFATNTLKTDGSSCFSSSSYGSAVRAPLVFADGEVYVKSPSAGDCYLGIRTPITQIGGVAEGYVLNWVVGATYMTLYVYVAGTPTVLSYFDVPGIVPCVGGDQFGLQVVGTTISAYFNGGLLGSVVDATFAFGVPGISTSATSAGFTNFGGAGYAPPSGPIRSHVPAFIEMRRL